MKILFAGTPKFALPPLEALLQSKHLLAAVYTKEDKPAGRGLKLTMSPVKELALKNNLLVVQPKTLRDTNAQEELKNFQADVLVDAACGLFLPKEILSAPKFGCINIHPSLLPRWRGAAPIQHAILEGDTETGVTIMQMDDGLDTGAILRQERVTIDDKINAGTLEEQLAHLGAKLLLQVLDDLAANNLKPQIQNEALTCYAQKITKEEALIDWQQSAININRKIRAFNPWPVAYTHLDAEIVRIFEAEVITAPVQSPEVGTIVAADQNGIVVTTGKNLLRILKLQLPGGKVLRAEALLASKKERFAVGKRFIVKSEKLMSGLRRGCLNGQPEGCPYDSIKNWRGCLNSL